MKKSLVALALMLVVTLLATGLSCAKPAPVETPKEFYAKNIATLIVNVNPGGAADFATRLIASFWPEVFSGDARVKNMAGGGGLLATNYLYRVAKPDGLTLQVNNIDTINGPFVFKQQGVDFDITKLVYIGMYADEPMTIIVAKDLPYNTLADLKGAKGLKFAGFAKMGVSSVSCALLIELLGIKDGIVISGYESGPEAMLAAAKGEVHAVALGPGTCSIGVANGWVKPIGYVALTRSQVWPNLPKIAEVVTLNPEQEQFLKLFATCFMAGRTLYGPPGIPEDRVEFLRQGFDKMVRLDGFKSHATTRYKSFEPPLSGKEVKAMVDELVAIPQASIDKMNEICERYIK